MRYIAYMKLVDSLNVPNFDIKKEILRNIYSYPNVSCGEWSTFRFITERAYMGSWR